MNWLTNYVRPKLQALVRPKDVPENLWQKCPSCGHMIFHRDLEKALNKAIREYQDVKQKAEQLKMQ